MLVLGAAVALFLSPEGSTLKSSALFARDPYSKETLLDVDAHLDRNVLSREDTVLLEINVRNNNPDPITEFHTSISAPGFEWTQQDVDRQLPVSLPAGSSATAFVPLKALANSGSYNIFLFYSWNKKSRYSSAVSIGPIKMAGVFGLDSWNRFLARGSQLIKDLTLPIVLAVLGYYFQLKQKNRDERQEVRQNILPLVMNLAERHYMPIVRSARLLIVDYNSHQSGAGGAPIDKVFFDVMFLLKRMDYLRRDKGQIFFQDSAAEAIAGDAWFILREKLLLVLGDLQVGLALQKIGNDDGYAEFAGKRYQYLLQPAFSGFQTWIASDPDEFKRYLKLVDLLQAIFRYEANRPFAEHWYNAKKVFTFETDFLENHDFPKAAVSAVSRKKIDALGEGWKTYYEASIQG